ncbi:DoxX family protein [Nocardioides solisilvae]|uniref:DoxX family protein n=1 Tax=Nocardioides solisilvae TaxID=1542435 RepID=UPI000D743C95|nr:DoxX family protein [Nocardioides solisilvae]
MTTPSTRPARDVAALAALFATSGTVHLVKPEVFLPIVPKSLPARRELVTWSGVAELACAAGLLHPRTRRASGWASAALLLAVYPANVKMAKDAQRSRRTALKVGTVLRLPLQVPMIRTALRAARA